MNCQRAEYCDLRPELHHRLSAPVAGGCREELRALDRPKPPYRSLVDLRVQFGRYHPSVFLRVTALQRDAGVEI